ncbi:MAG: GNAT family N-acetyltransferase [Spirochaetota bacterium]
MIDESDKRSGAGYSLRDAVFLNTDRTILRPLVPADLGAVSRWYNDPEIRRLSGMSTPFLESERETFYASTQEFADRLWLMIDDAEDGTIIGETGFLRYNAQWRCADFTLIIGESRYRGNGYGREVLDAMLSYGFGVLNLHRIAVGIVAFNDHALALYRGAGFVEEGRQVDGYYWDNTYHDFVILSLLENDYRDGRNGGRRSDDERPQEVL